MNAAGRSAQQENMINYLTEKMPDGFFAAPFPDQAASPLRICLIISRDEKPERLVPLAVGPFVRSFLGCLIDADDRIMNWLVLEFQSRPAELARPIADRLTNQALDDLWKTSVRGIKAAGADDVATGWELRHPPPLALHRRHGTLEYFSMDGAAPLRLCTDGAKLASAGLPDYAGSSARYIALDRPGAPTEFIATEESAGSTGRSLMNLMAERDYLPINPGCRFVRCRIAAPIDPASLADIFGGAPWSGLKAGKDLIDAGALVQLTTDRGIEPTSSSLFLGRHGHWGRTIEGLHLKIKMLSDMAAAVRSLLAAAHRPILNLSLSGFAARVSPPAVALPFLWTAQIGLVDAGIAVPIEIAADAAEIFTPAVHLPESIYQPQRAGINSTAGHADFRLRRVDADAQSRGGVEGTLVVRETAMPTDAAVSIRMTLSGREMTLGGSASPGTAPGEWQFSGALQPPQPEAVAALKAAEGAVFNNVWLDIRQNCDAAYDMYALAVCFTRVLLGGSPNPLPALIDDLHALARLLAQETGNRADRLLKLITDDERFKKSFSVENAFLNPQLRQCAPEMIPAEIWRKLLELLLKMLPGILPDAFIRRYGGIRGKNQAAGFDALFDSLSALLVQTRSLMVIDWRINREIHAVIRRVATGI
ncbi:MAG: hypothetical protein ACP5O1_01430 [Phycisphaerae bacterium]